MPNGDKLYTPKNIEVNCKKTAIECFMKEVEVLKEENQDNENITDIIHRIQRNIDATWVSREHPHNVTQERSACPQCEQYEQQHSKCFFKHLIEFLQFAYTRL
ncbi:interleukin-15-like [Vipera latastei]